MGSPTSHPDTSYYSKPVYFETHTQYIIYYRWNLNFVVKKAFYLKVVLLVIPIYI